MQGHDSLEKMLVHEMAVLHRGMMKAAIRMNEELVFRGGFRRKQAGSSQRAGLPTCRSNVALVSHVSCSRYSASEPGETSTSL
jgi:hypothetical protein